MKRVLTVFVAALALTLVPLGSAETSYSDASGDAGTVPDITTTAVSNTDDGVVTFRVTANMAPNTLLFANLDTDANPGTGSYGTDRMLAFGLMPSGAIVPLVFDANGTVVPGLAFPASFSSGVLQFSFPKEALAVNDVFGFWLRTMSLDEANDDYDDAPNAGSWSYVLTKPAPPPPAVIKPVIGKPVALATPVAGKRFTVAFPVARSDDGTPLLTGTATCKTTVAGKTVPHTHTFKSGTVKATVVVPKAAKGKQLKIAVKVTAGTQAATKVVTFKVK